MSWLSSGLSDWRTRGVEATLHVCSGEGGVIGNAYSGRCRVRVKTRGFLGLSKV